MTSQPSVDLREIEALCEYGQFNDAENILKLALKVRPKDAVALQQMAIVFMRQNKLSESLPYLIKAEKSSPNSLSINYSLANVLLQLNEHARALPFHKKAVRLDPRNYWAQVNFGISLSYLKFYAEAIDAFKVAISIDPSSPIAWLNLGNGYRELEKTQDAIKAYDEAIRLAPDFAEVFFNRGLVLNQTKELDAAADSYLRAIALQPGYCDAYFNLADLYRAQRKIGQAIEYYSKLYAIDPEFELVRGQLLHTKLDGCDWTGVDELISLIEAGIKNNKKMIQPFAYQAVSTSEDLLYRCAKIYSADSYPEVRAQKPKLSSHEKIHVGYVSGEFRHQATSLLMVKLFELHDKQKFKIFAFDNGWDDQSETRQRLVAAFDEIIDISGLSTAQASEAIKVRKIDILINLNGFFGLSRQDVFALRSSPIQVNYLGFPGTIGAHYMDYLIADQQVIPPTSYPYYSEKIVTLPYSYQANDRDRLISDKSYSRHEVGLPQDAFVFCCFNNNYKIQSETFSCWMRILERVPASVLWLLKDNAAAVENLKKEAQQRGIAPERLIFAERAFLPEHLARHRAADLFLDTLPYNAHTTASDALWAGLPVLTCVGSSFAARVGSSLLSAIGLPELITHTLAEYEALAITLATQPDKLNLLKDKLSSHRLTTPLFDSALFTKHIESAYEKMIERQRAQLPCEHFSIQP